MLKTNNLQIRQNLKTNLRYSLLDGCGYSLMVGLGETYFSAFMLAFSHSELLASLIGTLPMMLGGLFQLFSPYGIRKLGDYKKWVVLCVFIQALVYLPLASFGIATSTSVFWIFAVTTIYWTVGMGTGPAWNAWLNVLIPQKIRTSFFAKRGLFLYGFICIGMCFAGMFLDIGKKYHYELLSFSAIFLLAGSGRFISMYYLSKHTSVSVTAHGAPATPSYLRLLSLLKGPFYGKIILYLILFQFAVYFSAPFFNPYMLAQLHMPYWLFMLTTVFLIVGKVIMMLMMKSIGKKWSLDKLLFWASLGIALFPITWVWSDNVIYLLATQVFCGIFWGAYEICVLLIFINNIPECEKTGLIALYNCFQTMSLILGSLAGAWFFKHDGMTKESYLLIFSLSSALRFLCLLFYPGALGHLRNTRFTRENIYKRLRKNYIIDLILHLPRK